MPTSDNVKNVLSRLQQLVGKKPQPDDPYLAQTAISKLPVVASVTQLGIRLRVLIPENVPDALGQVQKILADHDIMADTHLSGASLEDVFVAVTLDPQERAA